MQVQRRELLGFQVPSKFRGGLRLAERTDGVTRGTLNTVLLYLVVVPVAMLTFTSFRDTSNNQLPWATSFTLHNYSELLRSGTTYRVLVTTAEYAVGAMALGTIIAVALAVVFEGTRVPLRRWLLNIVLAPLGLPGFVAAMAWVLLANPTNGLINSWLQSAFHLHGPGPLNVYSVWGMILVASTLFVPSIYLMISGTAARLDPTLEDASLLSGATPARTVRKITLPLLQPAIAGAAVFYLMVGIDTFEVPLFIGVPGHHYTLSTWIFSIIQPSGSAIPNYGLASAFGVLTTALALGLIFMYRGAIAGGQRFVTIGSRGFRLRRRRIGALSSAGIVTVVAIYGIVAFVLPIAVLVVRSIIPEYAPLTVGSLGDASLRYYDEAWTSGDLGRAAINTLIIASAAACGTMILSFLRSWFSWRKGGARGVSTETLVFASLGVPAVIIGIAMMLVYLWIPVGIYGTVWIIVVALVVRYLPYGVTTMGPALLQVERDLDNAATVAGGGFLSRLFKISLPMVWPAFARGGLWVFVQAARDATIVVILLGVNNVTVGAELYTVWFQDGNYAFASAVSMLLAVACVLLTALLIRFDPVARAERRK